MDLVSVVIPSYNYGRFVTQAVDSALAQTHSAIEVIVVDDGSIDDTRERLKGYEKRIQYIYQKNQGLSAARNTGIRHARGEWVALLDSDDSWHPKKTEMQLAAVGEDQSIGLVGSPEYVEMPEVLLEDPVLRELGVREFLTKPPVSPSAVMVRRKCFETVGLFDESLRSVEDRDMWLRLAARYRALQVCSPCWWYRQHSGQMNRNADRMFANYKRVLESFFREHPKHQHLRRYAMGYLYFDAVWSYRDEGRRVAALWRLAQSTWYRPQGFGRERPDRPFGRLKVAMRLLFGRSARAALAHAPEVADKQTANAVAN